MMHLLTPNLDKVLKAEKSEVELKLYEYKNTLDHAESMIDYYEKRLSTITAQIAERQAAKIRSATSDPIPPKPSWFRTSTLSMEQEMPPPKKP